MRATRETLATWVERYLAWARVKQHPERTIIGWRYGLGLFVDFCEARGLERAEDITRPILERYQRHLFHHRKKDGRPLSYKTQLARLVVLRGLFRWLVRQHVVLSNPAADLELPRKEHRLPRAVLTEEEAERVLAEPDVRSGLGVRDRAMLEVFYATGIRRAELVRLNVFDVDLERHTLMVRQGKGKKDRMLPLGERAARWVERYMMEVRPELVTAESGEVLFLGRLGHPFVDDHVSKLVKDYVDASPIAKKGSCHLFRHTMATLMLEGGADVRFVQEMLGHVSLETTQLYTRVSIRKLQEVHAATHPGARLAREPRAPAPGAHDAPDTPDASEPASESVAMGAAPSATELFSSLAAEGAEDA